MPNSRDLVGYPDPANALEQSKDTPQRTLVPMSRAMPPNLQHRFLRQMGIRFCGLKGVDWMLRLCHSPDRREEWHISAEANTIWGGPKFRLDTKWFPEWQTYFYGSQDRGIHRWVEENVRRDWVCIDVGVNFGFFACLCAQVGCVVHGFEPVEFLIKRAEYNRTLNKLSNLILNQTALSAVAGTVAFHLPSPRSSNSGAGSLVNDQRGTVVKVLSTTLDSYFHDKSLNRLDFIKIDVEGAEHLVLEGAHDVIGKYRPVVIFENNSNSRAKAGQFLRDLNYVFFDLAGHEMTQEMLAQTWSLDVLAKPCGR